MKFTKAKTLTNKAKEVLGQIWNKKHRDDAFFIGLIIVSTIIFVVSSIPSIAVGGDETIIDTMVEMTTSTVIDETTTTYQTTTDTSSTSTTSITSTSTTTETTTTTESEITTKTEAVATIIEATTINTTTTTPHPTTVLETTTKTESETINTTTNETTTVGETTPPIREYIVYKPSTHYVHRSTCRWVDNTCIEITSTEGYECRKCSECDPDIEIITQYVEPVPETPALPITEYERILLCNVVAREYGANYVPTAEKAKVVAVVMNRVRDPRFPNDIYSVLTQPYQFSGYVAYSSYTSKVTNDVIAAVDYYFNHTNEFSSTILYFYGDGRWNHFY